MKFLKNTTVLLILIVIVGFALRFYQLYNIPPSLTWDEVSWGYNAYSLGIDGKDEFGRLLPYDYLESFGDFKPPMYAYLDVIPIRIFGLNEFATRFPSAFFGGLTVLLSFYLVKRLFPQSEHKEKYALATSLFLALSPWHIMLSRAAFEANVATFLIVLGVWSFLAGVQERKWYLIISSVSFALSMYTFNTSRVVAPLIVIVLVLAFRSQLLKTKKEAITALIIGFLVFLPTFGFLLTPQAGLRFKEVNIFSDIKVIEVSNQRIENSGNTTLAKIVNNRRVLYAIEYAKHYFDNLSPNFLFIRGDGNPKFSIQDVGQMYIWDIVFFVSGIFLLLRKKEGKWWLVPLWLLIGIIPAATARETPHALRIETTLPTFQILVAYGFVSIVESIKKYKRIICGILLILLSFNFGYFLHNYFNHYSYDYSGEWQYGYKESIEYVRTVEKEYDYIQITNALGRPYMYYLFYNKVSPDYFRKTADIERDAFGFVTVNSFGKYKFPQGFSHDLSKTKKVLYINTPYQLPTNIHILKTFSLKNGQPVLVAYTYD